MNTQETQPVLVQQEIDAVDEEPVRLPGDTFAPDYRAYMNAPEEVGDAYIERELEKLVSKGLPVLSTVLSCRYDFPKTRALLILAANPQYRTVGLKLVPGVIPPDRDYNGALVPASKRGKVLAAKTGLTSHSDVRTHGRNNEAAAKAKYGARAANVNEKVAAKQYMSPVGRYSHAEIYFDKPTYLDFDSAVAVLTRYGYGIALDPAFWFVQEV